MLRAICLFVLVAGCSADECEKAIARLARIDKAQGRQPPSAEFSKRIVDACRNDKGAAHDPVLNCAKHSQTDADASACIDGVVKGSLKSGAGTGDGTGINPLLQ